MPWNIPCRGSVIKEWDEEARLCQLKPTLSELQGTSLQGLKSARPARLGTVCTNFIIIEFLSVAVAAYLAQAAYQYVAYSEFDRTGGLPAALALATLVCGISLAFRQFVGVQRQPLHTLLWNGIGAVALAFSCFLSFLFILKLMHEYSRGAFFFQAIAVSFTVCAARAGFFVWLQSAIRAGVVEARRVVLIGDERYRSQFPDLVKSAGFRSIASLPFPHHRSTTPKSRQRCLDRHKNGSAHDRLLPLRSPF